MITKNTPQKEVLKLTSPCKCDACTVGCKFGSGALADEDLKPLAEFLGVDEEKLKKEYLEEIEKFNTKKFRPKVEREGKPYGKCIFFDNNRGCLVHPVKPLECKIAMGCKEYGEKLISWFTLNQYVNENDPESIRQWNIFLKSKDTIPGGKIEELVPDENERKKIFEYEDMKM